MKDSFYRYVTGLSIVCLIAGIAGKVFDEAPILAVVVGVSSGVGIANFIDLAKRYYSKQLIRLHSSEKL